MRSVVITGASTGIGWASARILLDRGFRVFGSVRKQADADRLKGEFGVNFMISQLLDEKTQDTVRAPVIDWKSSLGPFGTTSLN